MVQRRYKRSGLFGLIGVGVVMVTVALIALDADPKGTMALIFGVIAALYGSFRALVPGGEQVDGSATSGSPSA